MMRSLYSGVAGLRTHQTKMDVLGNNIANVNTTSYKSQSITFSDLMYQTTQTASGASETKGGVNARQIGLGAKSGAISTAIESQGATQTTNNPFDIMITGSSFFVVNNGKENLYTRDGSFYVDGAGNLAMQSNGYLVQGWAAKEDKKTGEIQVDKNGDLTSLQIMSADNSTYSPASTTQALYSGNIDDHDTNVTSDDGKTITLEFYDNKGYLYTGKFVLKDTGMDHLFAIELTDIIDSSGQSIGSALLEHVTLGTPESKDAKATTKAYENTYRVSGNSTDNTAEIYLQPGAIEFSKVALTGTLADLMTSSTTSGKRVLNDVYGIKDTQVTGNSTKYNTDSAYAIDKDTGAITVSYNVVDDQKTKNTNFLYTSNASSDYYYDQSTGKGYKIPDNFTNKKVSGLSKYESTALTNVFKNSVSGAALTLDATHTYSFDGSKVTATNITGLTQQSARIGHDDILSYASDFNASSGYGDMAAALQYTKDDGSIGLYDPVFYSFDGEGLKIYNADYSDIYITAEKFQLTDTYTVNNTYTPVANLATVLSAADLAALNAQYPNYATDYAYYTLRQESGTFAIQFYNYDSSGTVKQGSTTLWDGKIKTQNFEPDITNFVQKESSKISDAFTNASQGYDYIALAENTKVADYPTDFLKTVFGVTDSTISSYPNSNVSFLSNGSIVISHDETTDIPVSGTSGYGAQYNPSTGAMDYVTTVEKKVDKWTLSSKQMSGKISDLKEVAEGNLAGLLKAVYGYDDEMADAFGSDGTYVIDPTTGAIKLTTGNNTVQLLFDPSTGAIKSANGNEDDKKVNLIFDQTEGLEAFGYQVGTSQDPEELAKKGTIGIDFSTVTNYNTSGSSTIKAVKGDKKSLNTGRAVGEMNGVNISTDGRIYATYSNGQTKLLGQIASAQFANASGLSKEGDNLYSATLNSGEATVQDITTDGGYMNTGVLEMSNVDLSREFTEMITTQRGFQANSRIITVSDTLLEELTNLKR